MTRIDRYIFRQFLQTFLFIVLAVAVLIVVIDFSDNVNKFFDREAPMDKLFTVYYFNMVIFLVNLLSPICVFLAVILFTANMAQKTEIVALLSAGTSYYRLLAPYMVTAVLLGAFAFYANGYLVPVAVQKHTEFDMTYLKKQRPADMRNMHRKLGKNVYINLYMFNPYKKEGRTVAIEQFRDGELRQRIRATTITWVDSTESWRLKGLKYRAFVGGKEYVWRKNELDTTFLLKPEDIYQPKNFAESLPLDALGEYIRLEKLRGSEYVRQLELERYERYAFPFAALILTVIGFAMASRKRRGGVAQRLGVGLGLCFVYVFVLVSAQALAGDDLPAWLAVWLPNIIFSVVAIVVTVAAPK